jgi:large subunit ribosomal protein L21
MYAIVDIAGQQFKVEKDQKIFVHRLEGEAGSNLFFDRVLLIDNGKNIIIGNPLISDALISVKILSHLKGDKVKIFKKKRRKGYQKLTGHRQFFTEIQINEILEKGGSKAMKDAAARKPEKEAVTKGKKVKEAEPKVTESKEQAPEVVAKTESVKKVTGKTTGKTKAASEKKASVSKKETGKTAGSAKEKTPPAEKSSKSKSKAAQSAPSKKTKKSSEK